MRKLRKVGDREWVAGVCAGIAYWLGIPAWFIRLGWIAAIFAYGVGVGVYILLWIFMPSWDDGQPADYDAVAGG